MTKADFVAFFSIINLNKPPPSETQQHQSKKGPEKALGHSRSSRSSALLSSLLVSFRFVAA